MASIDLLKALRPETHDQDVANFRNIGQWGVLNALSQHFGLTQAHVSKSMGNDGNGASDGLSTSEVSDIMRPHPLGNVSNTYNITNLDTPAAKSDDGVTSQPAPIQQAPPAQPQPATGSNNSGWATAGLSTLGAIGGAGTMALAMLAAGSGKDTPPVAPVQPPAYLDGTLEFEVPLIQETETTEQTTDISAQGSGSSSLGSE